MQHKNNLLALGYAIIFLLASSCKSNNVASGSHTFRTLYLQPYDVSFQNYLSTYKAALSEYCDTLIVLPLQKMPANAKAPLPNKYCASHILNLLAAKIEGRDAVLALTNKDICTSKNGNPHWGVFGLGQLNGKSCIVSNFRLTSKNSLQQFHKIIIHELGHTRGLPHCKQKACYMQDAEGKNKTDSLTHFCEACSKKMY